MVKFRSRAARSSISVRSMSSDGLVAGVAPLPADEVGQEYDEDESCQSCSDYDGDQHVIFIQLAFHS